MYFFAPFSTLVADAKLEHVVTSLIFTADSSSSHIRSFNSSTEIQKKRNITFVHSIVELRT